MNRLHQVFLFLFLISTSISERLGCDVNGTMADATDTCKKRSCPTDVTDRDPVDFQFKDDYDPRFDQMFALRIIGGACVTQQEIYEAHMKLIYIYSCIFPIIHDKQIKDLNPNTTIRFGEILELDQRMQRSGRSFLHSKEENDPELIKRKVDDFIKDLLERNAYKEYRRYTNNVTSSSQRPEPVPILNNTPAKPPLTEPPTAKPIVTESTATAMNSSTNVSLNSTAILKSTTKPSTENPTTKPIVEPTATPIVPSTAKQS